MSILAINGILNLYNKRTAKQQAKQASKRYSSFNPQSKRVVSPYKTDVVELSQKNCGHTGWVEIPSRNHDNKNFYVNLGMLRFLWNKDWKMPVYSDGHGNMAPDLAKALSQNDFHVYCKNGKPVIAVEIDYNKYPVDVYESNDSAKTYSAELKEHIENLKDTNYSIFY